MAAFKRKSSEDGLPTAAKLYRQNQQSYISAGGFDEADDEYEERREQIAEAIQKKRDLPFETLSMPDNCSECSGPLFDSFLWDKFNCAVCDNCRDGDGKHKLIARTDAKAKYLLKDCDFDLRKPPLRFISKKNPHNPRYGDMKLYLKNQLEDRMLQIYGSWEKLDEAKEQKTKNREVINERRFEKKIKQMRKEVRGNLPLSALKSKHEHQFTGEEELDASSGEFTKKCTVCGYLMRYEKL